MIKGKGEIERVKAREGVEKETTRDSVKERKRERNWKKE